MARKEKTTLDFIQIDCVDKTTLKRLTRKFGKEGRLFWFDLLRLIGRTNNYIIDLSDPDVLEDIMMDELDIDSEIGIDILNHLAKWGNICSDTWYDHKNVWCQNLIDRHLDLFKKRKNIPVNNFTCVVNDTETNISDAETNISDTEMQQIKENKSKVNTSLNKEVYTKENFLQNWNEIRSNFLKTPSNLNRLYQDEENYLNENLDLFTKDEWHLALFGLFKQKKVPKDIMRFRPKHFLNHVAQYLDAERNKQYDLYV